MTPITEQAVYPSITPTIKAEDPGDDYGGAHAYWVKLCLGYKDGETLYDAREARVSFVRKNSDGTVVAGFQSEQLVLLLIDRHHKLNAKYPSAQHAQMIAGLQMFLDACKERVDERVNRGVMGELKR